jgi:tRNA(Ile)-lysidine synthase
MLLEKVKANLQNECNLSPQDTVVVGVSGGADSIALLSMLVKCGYRPVVAHFNHQIRPTADRDEEFVRRIAASYGLKFVSGRDDIRSRASQQGESLEEAARNGRYRFLFRVAGEVQADAVAVAHQADDQVETILMNLLRGSGLNGLSGMRYRSFSAYQAAIPLVRPLLDCWREEILDYCRSEGLEFVNDETNQDVNYRRNRVRLELIPELESYNPNIKNILLQMGKLVADDKELLDGLLQDALEKCCLNIGKGYGEMALGAYRQLSPALQKYLIRHYLATCFPEEKDLGSLHIEKTRQFLNREIRSLNLQLNDVILLRIEGSKGVFIQADLVNEPLEEYPYISGEMQIALQPARIDLGGKWQMTLELLTREECGENYRSNTDGYQAYLDAAALEPQLILRTWLAGDRYQPLGMADHDMKVSDFWIDHKIPMRVKSRWPLIYSGRTLIWIPGFQPCEQTKIKAETRDVVHLTVSVLINPHYRVRRSLRVLSISN